MNEKLLHFIWRYKLFNTLNVQTTDGLSVELLKTGLPNTDAGPDFTNARIKIGNTEWVGNVELHINSVDWNKHGHQNDAAYNNVILHAVYNNNGVTIKNSAGNEVPVLELKQHIKPELLARYEMLMNNKSWIPCENNVASVDAMTVQSFLNRLTIERLESKVSAINELLKQSENDWENVTFQMIAKYIGGNTNSDAFLMLARKLPVKLLAKHSSELGAIEAFVFGQAGFLKETLDDEYHTTLRREFNYLKKLHSLVPLEKSVWKFLRIRPANFPTIRLAQLAWLMHKNEALFSKIIETKTTQKASAFLKSEVSSYWKEHYVFAEKSNTVRWHAGSGTIQTLLINAIVPLLFAYGKYKGEEEYCERAIDWLQEIKSEKNAIINQWSELKIKAENAAHSQALLQLKNEYCSKFRCLECNIGHRILQMDL
jgi:hypothetical protein